MTKSYEFTPAELPPLGLSQSVYATSSPTSSRKAQSPCDATRVGLETRRPGFRARLRLAGR